MAWFKKIIFLIPLFVLVIACEGIAQQIIPLDNPSFEDMPRRGGEYYLPIKGWQDCGLNEFPDETPPDIHPVPGKAWEVSMQPQDDLTYLGLVVRYNSTYESLSQKLQPGLVKGKCYSISLYLARSESYKSATKRSRMVLERSGDRHLSKVSELENFIEPVVLQIWGGNDFCEKKQILAQSQPVENSDWELTELNFSPNENLRTITIVAFYADGTTESYNGNVLVDNMSSIVEIECN